MATKDDWFGRPQHLPRAFVTGKPITLQSFYIWLHHSAFLMSKGAAIDALTPHCSISAEHIQCSADYEVVVNALLAADAVYRLREIK